MNECPICGFEGEFKPFGAIVLRLNAKCPNCGSLERKRLLYLLLISQLDILKNTKIKVLHFAPSRGLYDFFKNNGFDYYPKDINSEKYKLLNMDIDKFDLCTDLTGFEDDEFDLILSTHVLEHIPCSYIKILKSFNRILKPGGMHIICVPLKGEQTLEDTTFDNYPLSDETRTVKFGGRDHYRVFGNQDFKEVLELVFGNVEISNIYKTLTEEQICKYNVDNSLIFISYKES